MSIRILNGDCRDMLKTLTDASVNCCVTSPPYFGLRDYGVDGQIGLEQTPDEYVAEMVAVFREVRRVLRDDGTLWLNLGDSYSAGNGTKTNRPQTNITSVEGVPVRMARGATPSDARADLSRSFFDMPKPKDLIGIPWRVAFALQADGWYLRQDIIWHKPNPMPESVKDRCTKAHEYVFMLSKSPRYFYDAEAITEAAVTPNEKKWTDGGSDKQRGHSRRHAGFNGRYAEKIASEGVPETRNRRSVWSIATQPFSEAHFATMAPELAETCIKAGCPKDGTVLDPFGGAGTTGLCADRLSRDAILIELNPEYVEIARRRLTADAGMFAEVA